MENASGMTFQNILPFLLAILLIFIIPMLMRRYGLTWEDVIRMLFSRARKRDYADLAAGSKAKREPWQTNGRSQDIQALVSTLLIFVRRHKLGLVYPGTVEHGGKMANLVALLVTRDEVIGINCFGFGGTITERDGKWTQHMNGADRAIPDPLEGDRQQAAIVRAAMDANGMAHIPLRVMAVFTGRTVEIRTAHPDEVCDTRRLLDHLKRCVAQSGQALDPAEVSRRLNGCVTRLTRSGK
ncbi:MAG: hypothetical protein IJJ45_01515 [Clostridia bacterium]|nr:hypothetical protein [Clostridia bacterium]